MKAKQIKLYYKDEDEYIGSILLPNGDIICGCCGCIFSPKNRDKKSPHTLFDVVKEYNSWVDITDEIIDE